MKTMGGAIADQEFTRSMLCFFRWLKLMCFDDPDWAEVFSPSLPAIRQPTYEIGRPAVALLLHSIQSTEDDGDAHPRQILLTSTVRNSRIHRIGRRTFLRYPLKKW
jgi:Periplasmic binding protein-like domain